MRLSFDGGRNYPRRLDRPLSDEPPACPAAVYIYDDQAETRLLAADFDVKRAGARGAADAAGQVAADAAGFAALVRGCGGAGFGDVSPNGGRHGYVLWAAPLPFAEMRRVALALARRFPSLDPSPMLGREDGIIRPPGSWHRGGGVQELTTVLEYARRCVAQPNGPVVWERLLAALSGELEAVDGRAEADGLPGAEAARDDAGWRLDPGGMPWLELAGGRVPALRPDLELVAVTGEFDAARRTRDGKAWTPSEARFAVLCSAAARGWQLGEVTGRMRAGAWAGLAGFYARYRPGQRPGRLAADWKKAVAVVTGEKSGRQNHTRGTTHSGGLQSSDDFLPGGADGNQQGVRRWYSAVRAAERARWPGAHGITVRLVLRALAAAAQMSGGMVIEFGTRSLGLLAGLDHSTVARVLCELREEPDPFVDLVAARRGLRGDLYMLRIPEAFALAAAWRRWRPGRLGVHPVFRKLGGATALVWEELAGEPVRTIDLPVLTGLSATAVSKALAVLAGHGMAERGRGGWARGPADAGQVAAALGVPELMADLQQRYQAERQQWRGLLMLIAAPGPAAPDPVVPRPRRHVVGGHDPDPATPGRGPPQPGPGPDDPVLKLLSDTLGPITLLST